MGSLTNTTGFEIPVGGFDSAGAQRRAAGLRIAHVDSIYQFA
jgi:hypothetical protein